MSVDGPRESCVQIIDTSVPESGQAVLAEDNGALV